MIPQEIIEQIRNKADIVAIVSEYVKLKKRGKNFLGLCPFHSEKDASFTVSPEKQIFHCFGCNEGGNAFAFLMKIENIAFAEAVEELGAKVGIAVPRTSRGRFAGSQEKLFQVMLLAMKYYQDCLDKHGAAAQDYLKKRGITRKSRDLFALGFAPPAWDSLFKHLISRGVAPELLEKSGLILPREGKNSYYDRFRNRLIFPIFDHRGRPLAFGGRSTGEEEPKYLNSPETLIYHKGKTLFGLNLSRESIKKNKSAILVEGYFDLITPFQAGIVNIVASLGTALTAYQCKLLARYCETVILAFDADSAGGVAAERSIELLKNQGLKVKIAKISGGKDPDGLIQKEGEKAFLQCISSALPSLEFKIKRILSRHNLEEIESRAKALREVAQLLSREKDHFIQKEYAKLAASLLKIEWDTLSSEIKRFENYQSRSRSASKRITEKPPSKVAEAEKNLIAIAAQDIEVLNSLKKQMPFKDFTLPKIRTIAEALFTIDFADNASPAHFLLENLPGEETRNFLSQILLSEHLIKGVEKEKVIKDCLEVIRKQHLKTKIDALKLELKEAEKAGENQKVAKLLSVLSEIF